MRDSTVERCCKFIQLEQPVLPETLDNQSGMWYLLNFQSQHEFHDLGDSFNRIPQTDTKYFNSQDRYFLNLVKVNHEVNHGIRVCDWPIACLTSRLNLTMCRKDRTLVNKFCTAC